MIPYVPWSKLNDMSTWLFGLLRAQIQPRGPRVEHQSDESLAFSCRSSSCHCVCIAYVSILRGVSVLKLSSVVVPVLMAVCVLLRHRSSFSIKLFLLGVLSFFDLGILMTRIGSRFQNGVEAGQHRARVIQNVGSNESIVIHLLQHQSGQGGV